MTVVYQNTGKSPVVLLANMQKPLMKENYCNDFAAVKMEIGNAFPAFGTINDLSIDYSKSINKKESVERGTYLKISAIDYPSKQEKGLCLLLPVQDQIKEKLIAELEGVLAVLKGSD